MQKGLRRKLLVLYQDTFVAKAFFKLVALHHPFLPFPVDASVPALYIALMPSDIQDETSEDRQTNFRMSLTAIVKALNPDMSVDILKCDAIDEIEEGLVTLRASAGYQADFSNLRVERGDPTPLALMPWGIPVAQIIPPYGAVRVDVVNDFHYTGVTG